MQQNQIIQLTILPELDRTETRRTLRKVFAAYRQYKTILAMLDEDETGNLVFVPAKADNNPVQGFENAADPDTLRAPYNTSSGTEKAVFRENMDPQERQMRHLVYQVEKKVWKLPEYQREIIRRKYLTLDNPLPTHEEVWRALCNDGWYVGQRYYEEQEAEAMYKLAYGMHLERLLEMQEEAP